MSERMTWEYLVATTRAGEDVFRQRGLPNEPRVADMTIEDSLNQWAAEGWELFTVTPVPAAGVQYILRRPRRNDDPAV